MVKQEEVNHSYEDEIDLFELWGGLVQEKWTILIITLLFLALAGNYAFFGTKTYEVKVSLVPPSVEDIANLDELFYADFEPTTVYQATIDLLSGGALLDYLVEHEAIATLFENLEDDQIKLALANSISIQLPYEQKQKLLVQKPLRTEIIFQFNSAENTALIANDSIKYITESTKQKLSEDIQSELSVELREVNRRIEIVTLEVQNEINSEIERLLETDKETISVINSEIEALKQKALKTRLYRIERLQADLVIAKSLNIKKPVDPFDYEQKSRNVSKLDVKGQIPSNYWLGSKILSAEIKSLESRVSDDPYIAELPDLKRKLVQLATNEKVERLKGRKDLLPFSSELRKLVVNKTKIMKDIELSKNLDFSTFRLNSKVLEPSKPIKPKKALILAVAGVSGLMLGVFIALIRRAVKNRRQKELVKV